MTTLQKLGAAAAAATRSRGRRLALCGLILALCAVAARIQVFGNPVVHIDEQFYLLVGDRMLHGALPYVDIWDRKPVGLFLIYAAIRLLGGAGFLQYQIVATVFAWASAMLIAMMARRISSYWAGVWAGALYLFALDLGIGQGGQAPVFYNLFVIAAAAIVGAAVLARGRSGHRWAGVVAMLLIGVALQVKYTAVFEGGAFGLALIVASWRQGRRAPSLAIDIALWIGCALAPTVSAIAVYAWLGHLDDFVFANFLSIFHRGVESPLRLARRVAELVAIATPMLFGVWLAWAKGRPARDAAVSLGRWMAAIWLGVAILAVVVFGGFYIHYILPVLAPATVALAPLMVGRGRGRVYGWALLVTTIVAAQIIVHNSRVSRGDASTLATVVTAMQDGRNCPFVYDGYPAAYYVLRSCLPTTRAFPAHHQQAIERTATGVDQAQGVRAIMARLPDRVLTAEPAYSDENLEAREALYSVLRRDYRRIALAPFGNRKLAVYALDPRIPAPFNMVTPGYPAPARAGSHATFAGS